MLGQWMQLTTEHKEESIEVGARLEELLLDHAFQLQSTSDALADESEAPNHLLLLTGAANVLRDEIDDLLVAWRNEQGRDDELPDRFKVFAKTGTLTRLGIDDLFDKWWGDDPERLRLVSLVLVDLDRFTKLNRAAGPSLGDVAIERFAECCTTQSGRIAVSIAWEGSEAIASSCSSEILRPRTR